MYVVFDYPHSHNELYKKTVFFKKKREKEKTVMKDQELNNVNSATNPINNLAGNNPLSLRGLSS